MDEVLQLYTCAVCCGEFWSGLVVEKSICLRCKDERAKKRKFVTTKNDGASFNKGHSRSSSSDVSFSHDSSLLTNTSLLNSKQSDDLTEITCMMCSTNIFPYSTQDRNQHVSQCLSSHHIDEIINNQHFCCIICDENLLHQDISKKCQHLSYCAKVNSIRIKDLLQMLAPEEPDLTSAIDDNRVATTIISESSPTATAAPKSINAFSVLMSNAKSLKKTVSEPIPRNVSHASRYIPTTKPTFASAPDFKKVQFAEMPLPIIVDGFQYASTALSDSYILTHFHSDHYIGLNQKFNAGTIYCSPSTCNLVKEKLRIKHEYLMPLELNIEHTITIGGYQVKVTFIDANHCPGAVCVLFRSANTSKVVLHTGDFRYCRQLLDTSAAWRDLASNSSNHTDLVVYLDTTYCAPQHCFPPQQEAISAIVEWVKDDRSKHKNTLYVFGAYGIGKERVFMAVAEALNIKVHVDNNRRKTMSCYNWPASLFNYLTTDSQCTCLRVVSMNQINFKALEKIKSSSTYNRIVAFQPTGWSHGNDGSLLRPRYKGNDVILAIPYSEHSSFNELVDFVNTFTPQRIVPTVNTSKEKVKEQIDVLRAACTKFSS